MSYFEQRWKIKGTILSPVHIGCDEVLDPFSIAYEQSRLFEFDLSATVAAADARSRQLLADRLNAPMTTANHADEVRKLILRDMPWRQHLKREFKVSSFVEDSFGRNGERFIERTRQAEIQLTAQNPLTGQRIIPGTSLKGALRTAVLEKLSSKEHRVPLTGRPRDDDPAFTNFQKRVLAYNVMDEDPFGELKISDCRVLPSAFSLIEKPVFHRRGLNKEPMAFTNLVEVLDANDNGPHFEGTLSIVRRRSGSINKPLQLEEIIRSVNRHAHRAFNEAYRLVKMPMSFPDEAREDFDSLWDWIESVHQSPDRCVLRVGRFTGFLDKTVYYQRYLKAFVQKGQVKREALSGTEANPTLRPLTHDGLPFGFVLLEFEELPA